MGRTTKFILVAICSLQLLTTIERQIFDFLGYMWAPILVNFFQFIYVIIGIFGIVQELKHFIVTYFVWNFLALVWNLFIIYFYVEGLDRHSDILNLGTGSFSWWEVNGYGCTADFSPSLVEDVFRPQRPEKVTGCLVTYDVVEIIHASVQITLIITSFITCLLLVMQGQKDNLTKSSNANAACVNTLNPFDADLSYKVSLDDHAVPMTSATSPITPMTPRRVKRRSDMTRSYPYYSGSDTATIRRPSSHARGAQTDRRSKSDFEQTHAASMYRQPDTLSRDNRLSRSQRSRSRSSRTSYYEEDARPRSSFYPNEHTRSLRRTRDQFAYVNDAHVSEPEYVSNYMPNNIASARPASVRSDASHYNSVARHVRTTDYPSRPTSARSSYSNFHGARNLNVTNERAERNERIERYNRDFQSFTFADAAPQIPARKPVARGDVGASSNFLSSGPPAYSFRGIGQFDYETPM